MRLRQSSAVSMCPSCGFAMPGLDICGLTNTCVECARRALRNICETCPDKASCDIALEGLKFVKSLEPHLDVYVDVSRRVIEKAERYGRARIATAFMKSIMGLINAARGSDPSSAFPTWVKLTLRASAVAKLIRTPYVISEDFYSEFKALCREFGCNGLEVPLSNLLVALISLSLIEKQEDPSAYFNYA